MPYLRRLTLVVSLTLFAGVSTSVAQETGVAPPADDETLIYVLREGRFAGSMNKMWVAVNDQTVGRVENDAYAVVRAKAGSITVNLATAGIVAGAKAVDDRPGETVYLTWRLGDIHMTEMSAEEALPLLASLQATPALGPDELLPNNEQVQANFALDIIGMDLTQPETTVVEPDDEHAVITVFRRDKKDRLKVALWGTDGYIAALDLNQGVRVKVPAGEVRLFAGLIPDAFVRGNVEAGKSYYVSIDIGVVKFKVEPVRSKDKRKLDKWLTKVSYVAALDADRRTNRVREREQIVTGFLNSSAPPKTKPISAEHAF